MPATRPRARPHEASPVQRSKRGGAATAKVSSMVGAVRAELKRYELLHLLATGGFAEVYLARTLGIAGFERLLVIKKILPRLAAEQETVQMFLDEARIAATLQHTNIVQVH